MMNPNTSNVDHQADLLYQIFACIQEITKQHAAISKILQEKDFNCTDDFVQIQIVSSKAVDLCHKMRSHLTWKR